MKTSDPKIAVDEKAGTYTRTYTSQHGKVHQRTYALKPGKRLVDGKFLPRRHGDKFDYDRVRKGRGHRLQMEENKQNYPKMRGLLDVITAEFGVRECDIYMQNREPGPAVARKVAMYLSCIIFDWSYTEAGRMFLRDRNSIKNAAEWTENERDDPKFDARMVSCEEKLTDERSAAPSRNRIFIRNQLEKQDHVRTDQQDCWINLHVSQ